MRWMLTPFHPSKMVTERRASGSHAPQAPFKAVATPAYIIAHPPSLWPPCAVVVFRAVLQMSSNASVSSSPVTAEHSAYLSTRISWAT